MMNRKVFCIVALVCAMGFTLPNYLCAAGAKSEAEKKAQQAKIDARNVWQKGFKKGAAEDHTMVLNEDKEPNLRFGFKPLFDGKTLKGWKTTTGNAKFFVRDGAIVGEKNKDDKINSFLATEKDYKDFILTLEYRWGEKGNSGVMVRARVNDKGRVAGPQVEIETNDNRRWTGGLYGESDGAWKYSLSREDHEKARQAVQDHSIWNRLTIMCKDGVIKTWVNGVPCTNFDTSKDKNLAKYKEGFIALQVHQGNSGITEFRNIKIKEL